MADTSTVSQGSVWYYITALFSGEQYNNKQTLDLPVVREGLQGVAGSELDVLDLAHRAHPALPEQPDDAVFAKCLAFFQLGHFAFVLLSLNA